MKPFLTPHASAERPQGALRPASSTPPSNAMRSTVLLSLLLAPRGDQDKPSRDR
jgi:hypothetical protein